MTLKDNLKFKFTIPFLVENYLRCHLNLFKKYRSWENTGGLILFEDPVYRYIKVRERTNVNMYNCHFTFT